MAEKVNIPAPAVQQKFDEAKAQAKLEEVEAFYLSFEGKAGFNPHFFLQQSLNPLQKAFSSGDRTEELYKKIMALEQKEPRVIKAEAIPAPTKA